MPGHLADGVGKLGAKVWPEASARILAPEVGP
jgi:hypothetical protein